MTGAAELTGRDVILVVDDEAVVRAPIVRMLQKLGYVVLEAENGEDALRVMQEHHEPVHLVISDVIMPEMDGAKLVSFLRSSYPGMRMLFMSGYSAQMATALAGEGKVDGVHMLAKPFTMDELATRVREILDSEWPTNQPGAA